MTRPRGLELDDYALACAALGDGLDEALVLAHLGVEPRAWPELDERWAADLHADPSSLLAFREALDRARRRLSRSVEPLSRDVGAYAALRWHLAHAPDREELLSSLGLSQGDLVRLEARWQGDAALAELAAGPHGPLPPLRVGALVWPASTASLGEPTGVARAHVEAARHHASAGTEPGEDLPPATQGPDELTIRLAPGVRPPRSAALPFEDPGARPPAAQGSSVTDALPFGSLTSLEKTMQAGELTSRIDLEQLRRALPFEPREALPAAQPHEPPARARPDPSAALPFQPRRPSLSIEHYGALCAELHLWPGAVAQALARYGVAEEAQAELHEHFRQRFAESPADLAIYQAAYWARRRALGAG